MEMSGDRQRERKREKPSMAKDMISIKPAMDEFDDMGTFGPKGGF